MSRTSDRPADFRVLLFGPAWRVFGHRLLASFWVCGDGRGGISATMASHPIRQIVVRPVLSTCVGSVPGESAVGPRRRGRLREIEQAAGRWSPVVTVQVVDWHRVRGQRCAARCSARPPSQHHSSRRADGAKRWLWRSCSSCRTGG
eukprot:1626289-Pleurochrysis_carterae.AAC.17